MTATTFNRFCGDLCRLLAAQPAEIETQPGERSIARISLNGEALSLLHTGENDGHSASASIDLGQVPQSAELATWTRFLAENFEARGTFSPRYGRDLRTGNLLIHCTFDYGQSELTDIGAAVLHMVDIARELRREQQK